MLFETDKKKLKKLLFLFLFLFLSKCVPKSLQFNLSYKIPTRVCWKKNNSPLFSITVMNKLFTQLSRKHLASWAKTPT
jgi:hypothetical protein